jgi:tRNA(Ile)-lysidine synthase
MEEAFRNFWKLIWNAENPGTTLLAVSGGVDSIVLCHLMHQCHLPFAIAHVNFRLRGKESEEDEAFVKQKALSYGVPFHSKKFETQRYAWERKISVQMAARELRYRYFEEVCKAQGYIATATGHHQKDVVETILVNLIRGTGIAGLHGIRSRREGLIRPLLFATREEIRAYAESAQLVWREDSSNQSSKYHRNLIRNEILPAMRRINPSAESALAQTAERLNAVEAVYRHAIEETKKRVFSEEADGTFSIALDLLFEENEPILRLFEIIKPFGFHYQDAHDLMRKSGQSGRRFYSGEYEAITDRMRMVLRPVKQEPVPQAEEWPLRERRHRYGAYELQIDFIENWEPELLVKNAHLAFIDADCLKGGALTIRSWQEGDWFQPLGMPGRKKLSDFFVDQKIPVHLKEHIPIICQQDEIIWIGGLRLDERYRVKPETKQAYRLELKKA